MMQTKRTTMIHDVALEELRRAVVELFGAERRLRGRDQQASDVTQSQVRALSALSKGDAVPAGQLAKSADLNPASVTAMLDQLEDKGIVERHRDSKDRRVCMVSLTRTGRAILADRRARWFAVWDESFGGFTDEELDVAVRTVRTIIELLDAW